MLKKKQIQNLTLLAVTLIASLLAAEFIYRNLLFGKSEAYKNLRDPGKFASSMSEDYWRLYYMMDGFYKPPEEPHHVLGWTGPFDRYTYLHTETPALGKKRPVMIFGDSFVLCIDTVSCFEDLLNTDTVFNRDHYLLNYGVGGFGVDQIFLLCSLSITQYQRPFVVFSIMPADMDRSILTLRTGQKPYFVLEGDSLLLKGVPINPKPSDFFKDKKPSFQSYLFSRFMHSKLEVFGRREKEEAELREEIMKINEPLILQADRMLRAMNVDYVFMVFDNIWNADGNWRTDFLTELFEKHNIPWFNPSSFIQKDSSYRFNDYIVDGDGHPTTYYNSLAADEIKRRVMKSSLKGPVE